MHGAPGTARDVAAVQPGQEVLVIGAGGGVGTYAVPIAKELGARVTGVCSTTKIELVRSLGADQAVDYTREDFTRGHRSYDVIFQLAGTASPSACRRALTPKGTLVLSSGEGRFSGIDRLLRALVSSPFVGQQLRALITKQTNEDLVTLVGLVEAGEGHSGHRQDLPAQRCPRGDLPRGGGPRPREGCHHRVSPGRKCAMSDETDG